MCRIQRCQRKERKSIRVKPMRDDIKISNTKESNINSPLSNKYKKELRDEYKIKNYRTSRVFIIFSSCSYRRKIIARCGNQIKCQRNAKYIVMNNNFIQNVNRNETNVFETIFGSPLTSECEPWVLQEKLLNLELKSHIRKVIE